MSAVVEDDYFHFFRSLIFQTFTHKATIITLSYVLYMLLLSGFSATSKQYKQMSLNAYCALKSVLGSASNGFWVQDNIARKFAELHI